MFNGQFSMEFIKQKVGQFKLGKKTNTMDKGNQAKQNRDHLKKDLQDLVEEMNTKRRPFGKDIILGELESTQKDGTRFTMDDIKFLKELLLSYGPHYKNEIRSMKITPHFAGRFTKQQIYNHAQYVTHCG